jgi:phage/plasmid-associated DNA primase
MCTETDENTKFVTANINAMTGGDRIKARHLHAANKTFEALFKFLVLTNNLPNFTDITEALLRRLWVIVFPWSFKAAEDIDPANPYHKLRDDNLVEKLRANNIKLQMMNLMMHYFKVYKAEGLKASPFIQEQTNNYKKDLDVVKSWCMDNLVYSPNDRVSTDEMHNFYMEDVKGDESKFL